MIIILIYMKDAGWLNISVVKYALLFSVGVHHRPCASRVPALCQKHHSYKREL